MSDEQFHEFHLDGKQMVFLFMASTVMAVVIFLCGVMVGRGVRANKGAEPVEAIAGALDEPAATPLTVEGAEGAVPDIPPDAPDNLTYRERLDSPTPPPERLRTTESREKVAEPAPTPQRAEEPVRAAAKVDVPVATTYREPGGSGYAVQVMSVLQQTDAEAEAASLKARGYNAFLTPNDGKPGFRVRVGKYKTHTEAVAARNRLQKVQKYRKAWIPPNH